MKRPDFDDIESEIRTELSKRPNESLSDALEVIAYARHVENANEHLNAVEGRLEARISELEAALEALVPGGGAVFTSTDFAYAARVLRKGAMCDAVTHETWCEDGRPCAYHDGPKAAP